MKNDAAIYSNKKTIVPLITCLLIPLAVGAISGFATAREVNGSWFMSLEKPWFNPPNYLFAPVWTTLYVLMGISLYFVWRAGFHYLRKRALLIFGAQLLLNFAWSILFFTAHAILLSVIDIVILWFMIVWMIVLNWKIRPLAGYLQLPYLLWVSFASALDISIWALNQR